jgi:hypothetical protein
MKFKVQKRKLEVGDELGHDWDRWANGQAWRLKKKRDYGDVEPVVAMEAARNAADRMGKALLTVRDRYSPTKFIWVQFADDRIRPNEGCPRCDHRKLYSIHPNFLRCAGCSAMLLKTTAVEDEVESRPAYRLREFDKVQLSWLERIDDIDVYRGVGEKQGAPYIVIAQFRRSEGGGDLTADEVYDRVWRIEMVPYDRLSDIVTEDALKNASRSDWDLVL